MQQSTLEPTFAAPDDIEVRPTWLLFDADWAYTKQAAPFMVYCRYVVAVGRLKWFPDSKDHGKDSCAWYLFLSDPTPTEFISR